MHQCKLDMTNPYIQIQAHKWCIEKFGNGVWQRPAPVDGRYTWTSPTWNASMEKGVLQFTFTRQNDYTLFLLKWL